LADQPTTPSYRVTDGARYNTAEGFLGPVDATITRNQPGDYTVTLHNFAVVGATIRFAAYGGSSTCSDHESDIVGAENRSGLSVQTSTLRPHWSMPDHLLVVLPIAGSPWTLSGQRARLADSSTPVAALQLIRRDRRSNRRGRHAVRPRPSCFMLEIVQPVPAST
jgi:hypothetical protein